MGQFRICISDPDSVIIKLCRKAEQHIADHNIGMIASNMGELIAASHIANGKYMFLRGAQPVICGDAFANSIFALSR